MDCSLPGAAIYGISQATILEWVSISLSRGSSPFRDSQDSSPAPKFKSINSLVLSLLYGPGLTTIRDQWLRLTFKEETNLELDLKDK